MAAPKPLPIIPDAKLRLKLAEYDGYRLQKEGRGNSAKLAIYRVSGAPEFRSEFLRRCAGTDEDMRDWLLEQVTPDYANDERAMQALEAKIDYNAQPYYLEALKKRLMKPEGVSDFEMVNATARHRALAYHDFRTRIHAWSK